MKSPFQVARDWLGFHDETTRTQVALACIALLLMLPAFGFIRFAEWLENRGGA
jgi:hypothetical protein